MTYVVRVQDKERRFYDMDKALDYFNDHDDSKLFWVLPNGSLRLVNGGVY